MTNRVPPLSLGCFMTGRARQTGGQKSKWRQKQGFLPDFYNYFIYLLYSFIIYPIKDVLSLDKQLAKAFCSYPGGKVDALFYSRLIEIKTNNYLIKNIAGPVKFFNLNMLIISVIISDQVSNLKDILSNVFLVIRFPIISNVCHKKLTTAFCYTCFARQ